MEQCEWCKNTHEEIVNGVCKICIDLAATNNWSELEERVTKKKYESLVKS